MNAKPKATLEDVQRKIATLSAEDQARLKQYSSQTRAQLDDVTLGVKAAQDAEKKDYKIVPLYLCDANERLACYEHTWRLKKNAPPGMTREMRTVELNGTHFEEKTGGVMHAETLNAFYRQHERHRRQYELYTYDLVVLWAISNRNATNYFQIESELASRIRRGVITTVDRNELLEACKRLQRARLWTCGELPRPHKGKGVNEPQFQPGEVALSRNY